MILHSLVGELRKEEKEEEEILSRRADYVTRERDLGERDETFILRSIFQFGERYSHGRIRAATRAYRAAGSLSRSISRSSEIFGALINSIPGSSARLAISLAGKIGAENFASSECTFVRTQLGKFV